MARNPLGAGSSPTLGPRQRLDQRRHRNPHLPASRKLDLDCASGSRCRRRRYHFCCRRERHRRNTDADGAGPQSWRRQRNNCGPPRMQQLEQRLQALSRWVKAGVFVRLFEACSDQPDMEYAMVDATIVKAHRHGQGAKGGPRAKRSAAPRAA